MANANPACLIFGRDSASFFMDLRNNFALRFPTFCRGRKSTLTLYFVNGVYTVLDHHLQG
jgi:hypothetical protein